MKLLNTGLCVFLFAVSVFAQTSQVKFYQGDEYMPFLFEPYTADYSVNLGIFGATNINLRGFRTEIVEADKEWNETQIHYIGNFGEIGRRTIDIDLKTGLTKKFISTMPNADTLGTVEMVVDENNKVSLHRKITNEKGKVKLDKTYNFEVKEKLYPCYSSVMHSYLPYNENFAGTVNCFWVDDTNKAEKQVLSIQKVTFKVSGSETISNQTGIYDCYKVAVNTENVGFYDETGVFQTFAKADGKKSGRETNGFLSFGNSYEWIDKKTRKIIRAEYQNEKGFGVNIEIQTRKRDL